MININIDGSGAISAIRGLRRDLEEVDTIGKILRNAVTAIWIPNITKRLKVPTGTSGYEFSLNKTMNELDPDFVSSLSSSAWANQVEAERKIPGGYQKGEITKSIEGAIKPSSPIKGTGVYNPYNRHMIIRTGNQVFFDSTGDGGGVATPVTKNAGFKGRGYFVQLDGDFHSADYSIKFAIFDYMKKMLAKYNFKG